MTVHLLKPGLRIEDVHHFVERQKLFHVPYKCGPNGIAFPVWTSRKPARVDELLDGGSVYWIIKKRIQCRQAIIGFEEMTAADAEAKGKTTEKPSYLIMCDPQLIRVEPIERRPFQGWRYVEESSKPRDIGAIIEGDEDSLPPPELAKELREAGLL